MRRPFLLALLLSSLVQAACSNHCQDLGDRLCGCVGAGTVRDTCKREVQSLISANGNSSVQAVCAEALNTCNAPAGVEFCAWTQTECGKASCGMSNESPSDPAVCVP
jgi:hypothetical protein